MTGAEHGRLHCFHERDTGVLGGLLAIRGFPDLPARVLPAIIPLLFDVEKVRLTKYERKIHAELVLHERARQQARAPQQLYEALPEQSRQTFSCADFHDFLEKCYRAGAADRTAEDRYQVRPESETWFRITIL